MFYRYNLQEKIEFFQVNNIKDIMLDSIYVEDSEDDKTLIKNWAESIIALYKQRVLLTSYNYIVDRIGNIHELAPIGYDTILISNDFNMIRGVVSIATLSIDDGSGIDQGYMTSECNKSLYNLILNILIRLKYETGIKLSGSSLKLKCQMNYGENPDAGHVFFKNNPANFMALKRNITRGLMDISMIKNVMR
jgi:hypothetical protein